MSREALKKRVIEVIDRRAKEIIKIGNDLWKIPEVGYREYKTAEYVEAQYEKMGWYYENKLGLTGSKVYLKGKGSRPTVAVVGELDSLDIPTHPEADPKTGWVHACGHHAQVTAMLGIMGAHANRETFRDEDHIRFHPILTKGGEIVNNVPADVHMESFVRGANVPAIQGVNRKVNNALRAGTMAVGAEVVIIDVPGYMPYQRDPLLDEVLRENCLQLTDQVAIGGHSCGSTDMGDFSCVHPTTNLEMGGITGSHHHRTFQVVNKMDLYVLPAKALAITVIDLLYAGAMKANEINDRFVPVIPRNEYTEFMHKLVE
ncbi:MAG: hypothetical protein NWE89_15520 [Candidatus Bathyarchaeota archaeon]|nr:hypothetical protein [Candidatus Bathyarchaeota archaeon]